MSLENKESTLIGLIKQAQNTEFGKKYGFSEIQSYQEFTQHVPLQDYESLKPYIERQKNGEVNILWPGKVSNFAVSSGTTGAGKHIPIPQDRIKSDKSYQRQLVLEILKKPFLWSVFKGKVLSLPGGIERIKTGNHSYKIGEITGITASETANWLERLQVIPVKKLIYQSWDKKYKTVIQASVKQDVRVIIGAPTWIVEILKSAKRESKKTISKLWPNLKLIISGGVALAHYKDAIDEVLEHKEMHYLEMYGASEGYVGLSEIDKIGWFRLQSLATTWYEFEDENQGLVPLNQVQVGKNYSIRVTNNSGLWRYPLKDKIVFNDELKCQIVGRIGEVSDYFGESVSKDEVLLICKNLGLELTHIIIAPCEENETKFLKLYIQLKNEEEQKAISEELSAQIDIQLSLKNRHYSIRRETGAMQSLNIKVIKAEQIMTFLRKYKRSQQKMTSIFTNPDQSFKFDVLLR